MLAILLMKPSITAVILTFNEELHLRRCLENARQVASAIFIVDSFSTDATLAIARECGAVVYQNKWENNHARQFNWALDNLPIETEWVLRLDADEYLLPALVDEINARVPQVDASVSGIIFRRRCVFLNKWIKRGIGKMEMLRLFRYQDGFSETRWMDEHIKLRKGTSMLFEHEFVDHNLNTIGWWTQKHNGYSIREAIELLNIEYGLIAEVGPDGQMGSGAAGKRGKKLRYAKLPLFFRSAAYFFYRYVFLLGFTGGKEGFLWHFLQGWWYRTLVDAKVFEIRKACGSDPVLMKRYIKVQYGIEL
ncbi:glycosyltransferase family 2 protein [Variovorax sp. PAMC 28711]|uniref:glycosyltransferase family 2 protein n=1 Tax=Variovorax sp. PAMC 28711 TaxID=1795631 RepID=UPI000B14904B|nr:glycosyltransferase family 2 protein [Variovorax sp. PAMC 28711]